MELIGICSDHAGYELKLFVIKWLKDKGFEVKDFGTYSQESVDYPDYAHPLANALEAGEFKRAVALCGTGNGINITLNKHLGVRAALCWNEVLAEQARMHNDANILVLPGRYISIAEASKILDTFFNTEFEGGRHKARIEKMIKF